MDRETVIRLRKKAAIISLVVGLGMFVAKIGAYFLTGSAAIFSDAAESVVHVLATSMALYSIILSSKPADESHLYGHGNIEFFSAGIEGFLIIVAAFVIIYAAMHDIIVGTELKSLNIGVIVISGAGLINLALGYYLVRTGKKTNSLTLVADGRHVLTDAATSIGIIVGISIVIITGITIFDPLVAIFVALNIVYTGFKLIRESVGGLMLETDPKVLDKLAGILIPIKKDFWIDIHELRYWRSGDRFFMDFHLIFPYYFTIQESHKEEKRIDAELEKDFPNSQIKIHFDYCNTELCKFCGYEKCTVRKEAKSRSFEWNTEKLVGNAVYKIVK
jgi:cation diffusion facilitator family transporter